MEQEKVQQLNSLHIKLGVPSARPDFARQKAKQFIRNGNYVIQGLTPFEIILILEIYCKFSRFLGVVRVQSLDSITNSRVFIKKVKAKRVNV